MSKRGLGPAIYSDSIKTSSLMRLEQVRKGEVVVEVEVRAKSRPKSTSKSKIQGSICLYDVYTIHTVGILFRVLVEYCIRLADSLADSLTDSLTAFSCVLLPYSIT